MRIRFTISTLDSHRIGRLAKEGGWVIAGQIASVLGVLVLVRVLTEYLDPTQYGQLALGLTIAGLVNQVVMGGVTAGIGRFYSIAAEKSDLTGYLSASRRLMGYATVTVIAVALVLMMGLRWLGYSQWMGLAAAALVLSILSGYNASLSGIQNAARQRAIVAFHGGLDAWLKILLAVGVMLWLGSSSTAVVIGYVLSSLLVTSSQLFFLRRQMPRPSDGVPPTSASWERQMWAYSWPFSVWGIFTWLQQSSDRWAMGMYGTTQDVGLYAVLFQLGYTPIGLITGMVMTLLGPILYQRSGDASNHARNADVHRLAWRITSASLVITLFAFVLSLGLHPWIFWLFVSAEYHAISYLLPWVALAGGLFAAGQMLALKLMSDMNSAAMMRMKIMTALLGILFNVWGASVAGVTGIVGALVAFSVIYFGWMAWLSFHSS